MENIKVNKEDLVSATCLLLVRHFRNLIAHNGYGIHTRVFQHMLHPEKEFVFSGVSTELKNGDEHHHEHVVPCVVLISECCRLINENHPDEYIAELLKKHWKVAHITKDQALKLDQKLRLKTTMPKEWKFEAGDTLARFNEAGIMLKDGE
jgi:hypothetical protein